MTNESVLGGLWALLAGLGMVLLVCIKAKHCCLGGLQVLRGLEGVVGGRNKDLQALLYKFGHWPSCADYTWHELRLG